MGNTPNTVERLSLPMTVDMYGVGSFDYVLVRTLEKWSGGKGWFTITEVEQLPKLSPGGTKRQVRLESNGEAYDGIFRSMIHLPEMKALRFLGTLPDNPHDLWKQLSVFDPETRKRLMATYAFLLIHNAQDRQLKHEMLSLLANFQMDEVLYAEYLVPMNDDELEKVVENVVARYFLDILNGICALGY